MIPLSSSFVGIAPPPGVEHLGRPDGDGIAWHSVFVGDGAIALATPVARDEVLALSGARPVWADDALVGLEPWTSTVILDTRQPDRDGLRPPLRHHANVLQQVLLEALDYEPDGALGVVRKVGWSAGPGITPVDHGRIRYGALALRVDSPRAAGLPGRVDDAAPGIAELGWAGAAATGLLGLLAVAYRALERRARRERLDAWLASMTSERPIP